MADENIKQTNPSEEWDQLILRYLEGEESSDVLTEMREYLPDPRFQRKLAHYAVDTALLLEYCVHGDSPAVSRFEHTLVDSQEATPRFSFFGPSLSPASRMARLGAIAAAIAATALISIVLRDYGKLYFAPSIQAEEKSPFLCTLDDSVGRVFVDEDSAECLAGLGAGQTIHTVGALSSVRLVFSDGTAIQLAGDTALRIHQTGGQKQVFLEYGNAAAKVSPQPQGKPLMLHTSTAVLEVVGTEFSVADLTTSTELSVTEGTVLMKPRGGGKSIPVRSREFAEVRLAEVLSSNAMVAAPSSWSEDFDNGLPDEWARGEWVKESTSKSTGGAVATSCVSQLNLPVAATSNQLTSYDIRSLDKWTSGLVQVQEGTELTYRIKMDRPQWYQVFLCVRGESVPGRMWSWNYEYQEGPINWKDVKPGEWRELKVPLCSFKKAMKDGLIDKDDYEKFELRGGEPPPEGGVVVWMMFSTQDHDRGMVVDDISIGPSPSS